MILRTLTAAIIQLLSAYPALAGEVAYTSFQGEKLKLHAWVGRKVAVLTESADLGPKVMAEIADKLDRVYEFYAKATGREPQKLRVHEGRSTAAVVAKTCDARCGYLGATGIVFTPDTFKQLYNGVKDRHEWDQVICYDFGPNFWFYGAVLEYKDKDDVKRSVTTGYAVFMRFMAMEAAEMKGGPFRDRTSEQFKTEVENLVDFYGKDPKLNWSNTLRLDRAPKNPMGLNGTDLIAGHLFRLRRTLNDNEFVGRLWQEAGKRLAAMTTQDSLDNFVIAASAAAKKDLTPLFVEQWRWPISDAAKAEAARVATAAAVQQKK